MAGLIPGMTSERSLRNSQDVEFRIDGHDRESLGQFGLLQLSEAVLLVKSMRRQKFFCGAEKDLGDAFRTGVRQQGIDELSRHAELAAAKRSGNKHFPQ